MKSHKTKIKIMMKIQADSTTKDKKIYAERLSNSILITVGKEEILLSADEAARFANAMKAI